MKKMKLFLYLIIFIPLLKLISCKDNDARKINESQDLKPVDSSFFSKKQLTTHIIDIKCKGEYIPLRNRILSKNELELSQQGNTAAQKLNDEVIIDRLYNGTFIRILKWDTLGYHYIQIIDCIDRFEKEEQSNLRGFIISKYCGQNVLREMREIKMFKNLAPNEDLKRTVDFLKFHNPNGDLLNYAYAYISEEADIIQVLTFNISGINQINFKLYLVVNQTYDFLISGKAELINYLIDSSGIEYSRFYAFDIMGDKSFEIQFSVDNRIAFLNLNEQNSQIISKVPNDFLIKKMNRIK